MVVQSHVIATDGIVDMVLKIEEVVVGTGIVAGRGGGAIVEKERREVVIIVDKVIVDHEAGGGEAKDVNLTVGAVAETDTIAAEVEIGTTEAGVVVGIGTGEVEAETGRDGLWS